MSEEHRSAAFEDIKWRMDVLINMITEAELSEDEGDELYDCSYAIDNALLGCRRKARMIYVTEFGDSFKTIDATTTHTSYQRLKCVEEEKEDDAQECNVHDNPHRLGE